METIVEPTMFHSLATIQPALSEVPAAVGVPVLHQTPRRL